MKQKRLALWLKCIIVGTGVCGAAVYFYLLPFWGGKIAAASPGLAHCYWPWQLFLWLTAVPCCAVLLLGWRIAADVGRDAFFSKPNARRFRKVALWTLGDTAFFFLGNLLLLAIGYSHPGVAFFACLIVFAGIAVAVASLLSSHLVYKAARLREENELTI